MLLRFHNGDISTSTIIHHEVGCCPGGMAETRDELCEAYLKANLLLNESKNDGCQQIGYGRSNCGRCFSGCRLEGSVATNMQ